MASSTRDKQTIRLYNFKQGKAHYPTATGANLKVGCLVCLNADGDAIDGAAGSNAAGIFYETTDDALTVVETGVFGLLKSGAFADGDVGKVCFVADNQTVAMAGTGVAGRIHSLGRAETNDAHLVYVHVDAALHAAAV